jgi:hypothetical protein
MLGSVHAQVSRHVQVSVSDQGFPAFDRPIAYVVCGRA